MTTTTERQPTEPVRPTLDDQFEAELAPAPIVALGRVVTPAGFEAEPGAALIEGRRPRTWLQDAIAREHEITRRMGLLDRKPAKGANVA